MTTRVCVSCVSKFDNSALSLANEQRILQCRLFVNRIELRSAPAVINVRVKALSGARVKKKGGAGGRERRLNKVVC